MKNISTGTGIALLAGAIDLASLSLAADEPSSITLSVTEQRNFNADCPPSLAESWFAPTPRVISCSIGIGVKVTTLKPDAVDINGDGQLDYNSFKRSNIVAVWNAAPYAGSEDGPTSGIMTFNSVIEIGGEFQVQEKQVPLFSPSIGDWCLANMPAPAAPNRRMTIYIDEEIYSPSWSGWRDIDGDGDLDYVCRVTDEATWNAQIWFENIGFQKQPHLVGDLNADGKVNGADLGTLLVNWTP
jgi:hypothetical protein